MPQKVFVKKHILVEQPIISNLTFIWFDDFFYSFLRFNYFPSQLRFFIHQLQGVLKITEFT